VCVGTTLLAASLCARPVRRLPVVLRCSIQLRAMPTKPEVMLLPQGTSTSTSSTSSGSGHQCQRQRQSHSRDHSNSIRHASQVIFVDCDDCLYQNDWETAAKITTSIAAYTANLGVSEEKAYALYKAHGTCLKGMLAEGFIASDAAEDFLLKVRANPNLNPTPTPTPKPEPEPEPEPRP
jgi:hypothetical protein